MNCTNCQSGVKPDDTFCPTCGERQTQTQLGQESGLNQQGDGFHNQSPAYPQTGQSYPAQGQVYPPQGQGYPPPGQSYPVQGQSYPPPGQSYPAQGQVYPPQGQGYPPTGQSYPPQGQGYSPYGTGGFQPAQNPRPSGPRGKAMLNVVGILSIVFGATGLLWSAGFLACADFWDFELPIPGGMSWAVYYAFSIFSSLYLLITGIVALMHCARPEKADLLRVLGIISIVRVIAFNIFTIYSGAMEALGVGTVGAVGSVIGGLVFQLALPILYVVGAQQNLGSFRESQSEQQD